MERQLSLSSSSWLVRVSWVHQRGPQPGKGWRGGGLNVKELAGFFDRWQYSLEENPNFLKFRTGHNFLYTFLDFLCTCPGTCVGKCIGNCALSYFRKDSVF